MKRICMYVYISHFLSAWGDRMWQFGVGLFLVIIAPESLLFTAIYGFVTGVTILLFGPMVGNWVDKIARLSAARISLVIQNLSIAVCAVIIYVVINFKDEIENEWPDKWLLNICFGAIILISVIAKLASTGNTIAVQKDWIVEICGNDTDLLASTSAILKCIDLVTNIVAPIATGQIMAYASTEAGALFIGGWNVVSVFVEYYLLWKVYNMVPALRAKKDLCRVDDEGEDKHSRGKCSLCVSGLLGSLSILLRGWKTFMKYDVAFAGLSLASLYMTVLAFDNIAVGFAYTQGINESVIGGLMAAGAFVGILGTFIYPRMRKKIGIQRTGLFGLSVLILFLCLCVGSVWAPGSPFDLNYADSVDDTPIINATTEAPMFTATHTFNPLFNTTDNVTMIDNDSTFWDDYLSITLLMAGIIGARCGLWMSDLTITQLFLETVEEKERGIVFGVQTALNQLMDMIRSIMVIVAPQPELFGLLVLISFAFICFGWILYAKYLCLARSGTMGCSVRCAANFALIFVLIGIGAQIAGILTDYWCVGSRDDVQTGNETNSMPNKIHFGIFRQIVEYGNGTEIETDSSLNLKEEQYLLVSIAGINCIFCLIICVKAIHILVGVTSFIIMTLMLLSAFYSYEHTDANMHKLQDLNSTWPTLYLSWSFFLVFFGLIVNIIGTTAFLSLLLYKGEQKASKSSRGLGPSEVKELLHDTDTSENHVYENTAYTTETSGKLELPSTSSSGEQLNGGHPVSYAVQIDHKATDESAVKNNEEDIVHVNYVDGVKPADIYVVAEDDADLNNEYELNEVTLVESSRL